MFNTRTILKENLPQGPEIPFVKSLSKKSAKISRHSISQRWKEASFCLQYAEMWQISREEVHYGWLAPGEKKLQLLRGLELKNAAVLDVGCGMGENLSCLEKQGAKCFGIDISKYMLQYARRNNPKAFLACEDMRAFHAFRGVQFQLILSIYSFEYLNSLKEFRDVLAILYQRLRPGGTFVFCFSHPLQHFRHAMLRNNSASSNSDNSSPLIYSFKDVVSCLSETGFTIDRIVEQHTKNPSRITYRRGQQYPYHFHRDKNPCKPELDKYSNEAPHTIIYKVTKPGKSPIVRRQMSLDFAYKQITIWGELRKVTHVDVIPHKKGGYHVLTLAGRDEVKGICAVYDFTVEKSDLSKKGSVSFSLGESAHSGPVFVKSCSLLAIIRKKLEVAGIEAHYEEDWLEVAEQNKLVNSVFISRIDPLYGQIMNLFPNFRIGLLVFVNDEEPSVGKVALQDFVPNVADHVRLVYVISRQGSNEENKDDTQLALFD